MNCGLGGFTQAIVQPYAERSLLVGQVKKPNIDRVAQNDKLLQRLENFLPKMKESNEGLAPGNEPVELPEYVKVSDKCLVCSAA